MSLSNDLITHKLPSNKIRARVQELIPDFQNFCLKSNYDFVIPIESEGFSILWPALKSVDGEHPRIVPSSVAKKIPSEELAGKRVLIEDVSTYTGETILAFKNLIQGINATAKVDVASLIVYEGFFNSGETPDDFVYKNKMILSQNSYDWARDAVVDYISGNVFMHYGDPPLWEFQFSDSDRTQLYETLENEGTFYQLPNYCDDCEWFNFSLDNIRIVNSNWLPNGVEADEFIKIRIFVHKSESRLLILPLFFPIVPDEFNESLPELLKEATKFFPAEFESLLVFSREVPPDPYLYLRWFSTLGSMLLLSDFHKRVTLAGISLEAATPFLKGPIPNLRNYSCRKEVLEAFESVMLKLLDDNLRLLLKKDGLLITDLLFLFEKNEKNVAFSETIHQDLVNMPPEKYLAAAIGTEVNYTVKKNKNAYEHKNRELELDFTVICEFSFSELRYLAKDLTLLGINKALDVLVDESIMNLCFKPVNHTIRRGYYVGGESKRSILQALGYIYEDYFPRLQHS